MPVYRHCGHMICHFSTFSGQQYLEMAFPYLNVPHSSAFCEIMMQS